MRAHKKIEHNFFEKQKDSHNHNEAQEKPKVCYGNEVNLLVSHIHNFMELS